MTPSWCKLDLKKKGSQIFVLKIVKKHDFVLPNCSQGFWEQNHCITHNSEDRMKVDIDSDS